MTFEEAVELLFSKRPTDNADSVSAMRTIASLMGNPEKAFPAIHVTGTNGKGSVTHKIAKALQSSGLKVGLYTSPHLVSFCERIQINTVAIPEETARVGLLKLFELGKDLFFFEIATLLAFEYFRDNRVDVAIVEVGIGGRHDATNIVQPILSIITSVACDHEDLLGNTLEKIAYEKAGIIKPGIPVVIGPKADFTVIRQEAAQEASGCRSPLYKVEAQPGFYDMENTAIARQALEILPYQLASQDIEIGLKSRPACRFEQVGNVIFDVAHNPAGICRLLEAMEFHFPGRQFSVLIGMSKDKDVRKCLTMLAEKASHLYLVQSPALKAMSVEEMVDILRQERITHFTAGLTIQESIRERTQKILPSGLCQSPGDSTIDNGGSINPIQPPLSIVDPRELSHQPGRQNLLSTLPRLATEELLLVCGSFYIMKEAREEVVRIQVAHDQLLLGRGQSSKQ